MNVTYLFALLHYAQIISYKYIYFLVLSSVFSVVVESPRWLIANNRIKEATDIFKKVAKFNNVDEKTAMDVINQTLIKRPICKPGIVTIKDQETRNGKNVTLEEQDIFLNSKDNATISLNYELTDIASGNDVIITDTSENDFGLFPKLNGEDATLTDVQDEQDTKSSLAIIVILTEPILRWKAGVLTFIW